jgi:hypothetical protein
MGATIGLVPTQLGLSIRQTVSDPAGGFVFLPQTAGTYQLVASHPQYASYTGHAKHLAEQPKTEWSIPLNARTTVETSARRSFGLRWLTIWLERAGIAIFLFGLVSSLQQAWAMHRITPTLLLYGLFGLRYLYLLSLPRISGQALSSTGIPLAGVVMHLFREGGSGLYLVKSTKTDSRGDFRLLGKPGNYSVTASAHHYNDQTVAFSLKLRQHRSVNLVLEEDRY